MNALQMVSKDGEKWFFEMAGNVCLHLGLCTCFPDRVIFIVRSHLVSVRCGRKLLSSQGDTTDLYAVGS